MKKKSMLFCPGYFNAKLFTFPTVTAVLLHVLDHQIALGRGLSFKTHALLLRLQRWTHRASFAAPLQLHVVLFFFAPCK